MGYHILSVLANPKIIGSGKMGGSDLPTTLFDELTGHSDFRDEVLAITTINTARIQSCITECHILDHQTVVAFLVSL